MTYETVLTETRGNVGLVTLNRPEVRNALNRKLLAELMDALEAFDKDDRVGAMVVAGGEKAFAAGADIKEMADLGAKEMKSTDFTASFARIMKIQKPVIAAVSGWALGGGMEIALSCDMIIASESAKFGQPEITLGVIPGAGATQRLTHALGKARAMEMILNNKTLSAVEALESGLVNRVVEVEAYLEEAVKLAGEIGSRAPLAVRAAKRLINEAYERSLSDGLSEERRAFYNLFDTADQKEGMRAFLEKRPPQWKGK
ncbi:MAG TPA: enoyl-CoA hydratase-related protein [Anaerolineales bacterium]|nr:enoyl-CoA hydratase-related protein [Anaerolineales bacterium]